MAVFLLFFFHSARIFDPSKNFYIRNSQLSYVIYDVVIKSLEPWHMSLFFLLAGASTYYALRYRSGGQYVTERIKRLLVPFIFGVMVLIPPQSYLGLLNHTGSSESFFTWFPHFFTIQGEDPDGYFLGGYTWGHLWFIFHLLIYSLIALPLFLYLSGESGRRLTSKMAAVFANPILLLFFIPLILAVFGDFPDILGGNPLFYITFFVFGYVLMANPNFSETIDRRRTVLLILGPAVFVGLLAIYSVKSWNVGLPGQINDVVDVYWNGFVPWFVILTLMAYGKRLLNFTNRYLRYLAEASYPLYILHQTLIVIIGYFVVQTDIAVVAKFAIIVACAIASTLLTYDVLVKRNHVTRFLFGMKTRMNKNMVKQD